MIAAFLLTSALLAQHERNTKHQSSLLALPGELRNHIYTFCIEPSSPIRSRGPRKATGTRRVLGEYGGLLHVCRQVRTEFAPMYFARTPMILHQPAVNLYIQTFYPSVACEVDREQSRSASLEDRIRPSFVARRRDGNVHGDIYVSSYYGFKFNATLLMYLCMQYPSIRVHFREAGASLRLAPDLDALFATVAKGVFRLDIQRVFEAVTIRSSREPMMMFVLYPGVRVEDVVPAVYQEDVKSWLVSQGCPPLREFCVRVAEGKTMAVVTQEQEDKMKE